MHLCCCGCGNEVVTPLNPDGWRLTFDGESVSLHPSISNPDMDCRSHYWITRDKVCWVPQWPARKPGSRGDLGQVNDRSQSTVRRITDFGRLRSWLSILKTKLAGAFWHCRKGYYAAVGSAFRDPWGRHADFVESFRPWELFGTQGFTDANPGSNYHTDSCSKSGVPFTSWAVSRMRARASAVSALACLGVGA